jgi:hypothetical protein
MNKKNKKKFIHWLSVIVIGIALGFAIQFVRAWTEPSALPPGGNVGAPLNTSVNSQTKEGGLNILGFLGVGTNSPTKQIDAVGQIKSRTGFCINDNCISVWPSGGTPTPLCTCAAGQADAGSRGGTNVPLTSCGSTFTSTSSTTTYFDGNHAALDANPVFTCVNGVWAYTGDSVSLYGINY